MARLGASAEGSPPASVILRSEPPSPLTAGCPVFGCARVTFEGAESRSRGVPGRLRFLGALPLGTSSRVGRSYMPPSRRGMLCAYDVDRRSRESLVLWGAILFGLLGALIGLRYRAPALLPATAGAAVWAIVDGCHDGQPVGQVLLLGAVLTVALHFAYLGGIALRSLIGR
jgi:hypothetical protein